MTPLVIPAKHTVADKPSSDRVKTNRRDRGG
jgi:hypothetical protein